MFGGFVIFRIPFFKIREEFAQGRDVPPFVGKRFDGAAVFFVEAFGFVDDFGCNFDSPAAEAVGKWVAENIFAVTGCDELHEAAFLNLAVEVAVCGQCVLFVGKGGEGFIAVLRGVFEIGGNKGVEQGGWLLLFDVFREGKLNHGMPSEKWGL